MRTRELFPQRVIKSKRQESRLVDIELPEQAKQKRRKPSEQGQLYLFPASELSAGINPVSASKLKTYRGCSRAYRYKYVMHIPDKRGVPLLFGSALHTAIERFWKNRPSLEEFLGWWNGGWARATHSKQFLENFIENPDKNTKLPPEFYSAYNYYKSRGIEILTNFHNKNRDAPKPFLVEKGFKIRFYDFILGGKCDKVDVTQEGIVVTDYKSDKRHPAEVQLEYNYQFTIYDLALRHMLKNDFKFRSELKKWAGDKKFKRIEKQGVANLVYYHLVSGEPLKTERRKMHALDLLNELVIADNGIRNGDFRPFFSEWHCGYCGYVNTKCKEEGLESVSINNKAERGIDELYKS